MKNNKVIRLSENELHSVINKCVDRVLFSESLNNTDTKLYRCTSIDNLMHMMETNSIRSTYHRGYGNGEKGSHNGICFTRNKFYNPYLEYDVRMTFDISKVLRMSRGLRLIPYRDEMFDNLDEYEERLVSRYGDFFELNNLSDIVTEVVIFLDRMLVGVQKNSFVMNRITNELMEIKSKNIFGDKLKFVDNVKNMNCIDDVYNYIAQRMDDIISDVNMEKDYVYAIEYFDQNGSQHFEIDSFTAIRGKAIGAAKKIYLETGKPTRVTYGCFYETGYEMLRLVKRFSEVDDEYDMW